MTTLKDKIFHQWFDAPYILHANIKQPTALKKAPVVLFLHGLGDSGDAWREVIEKLPDHYRIVTLDLLGFGASPKPAWATYDARHQAKAVVTTYLRLRITGRVTIVGHSLGALVAVEIAKRYPLLVRSLILCSPPFYKVDEAKQKSLPSSDKLIKSIYRLAKKHPEQFIKVSGLIVKLGLASKAFSPSHESADVYMNALEATIINQTSLQDAIKLRLPIRVIYGRLDPIVVTKNLHFLQKHNQHVVLSSILASHEVKGHFIPAVAHAITEILPKKDGSLRKK